MDKQMIRLLYADEIECRAAMVNEKGLSLLLYKDARVDQRILDETFGVFGWKRSHQCINGNLYCTVEIRDRETGEWVAKQDVGTMGNAEKEKSQASDSFKRACFNWGIGRELYSAPFIWIPAEKIKIVSRDGRYFCNEHFAVKSIGYSGSREIMSLVIVDSKGNLVYMWKTTDRNGAVAETDAISEKQISLLEDELQRTGVSMNAVQERYGIKEPMQMSEELYNKVMNALSKTRTVNVA